LVLSSPSTICAARRNSWRPAQFVDEASEIGAGRFLFAQRIALFDI